MRRHAPMESGATLPDGTRVGRWRIVAFVARGGSGEVYRAVEADGDRTAALKILHRTDNPGPSHRRHGLPCTSSRLIDIADW